HRGTHPIHPRPHPRARRGPVRVTTTPGSVFTCRRHETASSSTLCCHTQVSDRPATGTRCPRSTTADLTPWCDDAARARRATYSGGACIHLAAPSNCRPGRARYECRDHRSDAALRPHHCGGRGRPASWPPAHDPAGRAAVLTIRAPGGPPALREYMSSRRLSGRGLRRAGAAAAAVAAGLPSACAAAPGTGTAARPPWRPPGTGTAGWPRGAGIANVHVSHDHYGVHIEPSVAANPPHPPHLLAACQASPTANPQFIATYLSFDAGATWHNGALPRPPAGQAPPSDDVTVAFDPQGRGYLCASRAANTPGGRAMFVWHTDDGGRRFSAPLALVPPRVPQLDHPAIAPGTAPAPSH